MRRWRFRRDASSRRSYGWAGKFGAAKNTLELSKESPRLPATPTDFACGSSRFSPDARYEFWNQVPRLGTVERWHRDRIERGNDQAVVAEDTDSHVHRVVTREPEYRDEHYKQFEFSNNTGDACVFNSNDYA
jgi:hypothetical protein